MTGVADPAATLVLLFPDRPGGPEAAGRYAADPVFRRYVDACAAALAAATGEEPRADLTAAEPAVTVMVGYALAAQLADLGLRPGAVAGDGSGRYAAASCAGVVDPAPAVHGLDPVWRGVPVLPVAEALALPAAVPVVLGPADPAYGAGVVPALAGPAGALATVAACWVRGLSPDWLAVQGGQRGHRVALPAYPFQRQRHWIERRR
jgi:acyl transferase domain-containing protein